MRNVWAILALAAASCGLWSQDVDNCQVVLGAEFCLPEEFEGTKSRDGSLMFRGPGAWYQKVYVQVAKADAQEFVTDFANSGPDLELVTDCAYVDRIHLREFRVVPDDLPRMTIVMLTAGDEVVSISARHPGPVADILETFERSIDDTVPSRRYAPIADFCASTEYSP